MLVSAYLQFIKPYGRYWLALALPIASTVVIGGWTLTHWQHTQHLHRQKQQQVAQLLQLDTLAEQLEKEQLTAIQSDLTPWQRQHQQTRVLWQQVTSNALADDTAALTTLKHNFNQLLWANKQGNTDSINPLPAGAYTPLMDQLATVSRRMAARYPDAQYVVQLRQLHTYVQQLHLAVKSILTHQMDDDNALATVQHTQWVSQWVQPNLADRQSRLFNELFEGKWQALQPQLTESLVNNNPFDDQLDNTLQQLDTLSTALNALLTDGRDTLLQQVASDTAQQNNQVLWLWLLMCAVPLTAIIIMGFGAGQQSSRLNHTLQWIQTMCCGNLTAKPDPVLLGHDALGQVTQALDELRHHWRRTLLTIHHQCDVLSHWAHTYAAAPAISDAPETPLPLRPMVDVPVLADDFSPPSPLTPADYTRLQQQLTALNQTSDQLVDTIDHWHGDTQTLSQHINHLSEPLQQQLAHLTQHLAQLDGLDTWVGVLQTYAQRGEQLIASAKIQALELAENHTDLYHLQQQVTGMRQEMNHLFDQLQQAELPVVTRVNSHTGHVVKNWPNETENLAYHPVNTLKQLLRDFSF